MNNKKEIIPYKKDNIKFAKKLRREATYSEKYFGMLLEILKLDTLSFVRNQLVIIFLTFIAKN